jgi:putative ABC transport system permease protein
VSRGTPAAPGRRAILRWAWRMFRREWRQQLLVLVLITVAVSAAVAGAAMAINAASEGRGEFGDASGSVHLDATDPAQAQAGIAAARSRFGEAEVIGHQEVVVPGAIEVLDLRAQDPDGHFGHPMLGLRDGRYPRTQHEVALTDGAADLLGAKVGEQVELGGVARRVVGRVENPRDLSDDFALTTPSGVSAATTLTVLVDLGGTPGAPVAVPTGGVPGQTQLMVAGAPTDKAAVAASVLVVTTLAMALVAMIAAAGFVVVAQRRQRQLGLLAALGATERHLRLVLLANGALVGAAAALVGGALGVAGWVAAAPAVEAAAGHRIDRWALPWSLVLGCLGLAVLASTAAAWWPARAMARMPVMSALSRRPARPSLVHRSIALAVVLVAAGMSAITESHPTGDHVRPLVLMGGVLALVIGVVLAAPAAIRALAAPAGHLPFTVRLALRDLARYQARAAAALAAITLGLGISVSLVAVAGANVPRADEGNLSDREMVVRIGDPRTAPNPDLTTAQRSALDARADTVAAAVGQPELVPLDVAMHPDASSAAVHEPISVAFPIDHGFRDAGFPFVATPGLLAALGLDASAVEPGTELLTSLQDDVVLLDVNVRPVTGEGEPPTAVQHAHLPTYSSGPRSLIPETAVRARGWVPARAGWLVTSSTPITSAQVSAARDAAAQVGLTIEARDSQDGLATLRNVSTGVGALLALAIVAMTIGLLRGESARDLRTLTATGASGRTRRALTASTAGALALLGVVLSTAGAYAALVAAYHAQLDRLVPVPATHLLLLGVGLPVAAVLGGWLLAGREPRTFSRQALD